MKTQHYSLFQIILHWGMAILFAINYIFSDHMQRYFLGHIDALSSSDDEAGFHIFIGISFVLLAVIRLAIRTGHEESESQAISESLLLKMQSHSHNLMYLLMFLIPAAGMSALYAKIEILGQIHMLLVNLMLVIILLHIIAGLYHQFILKDNLFSRMSLWKR